VIRQKPTTNSPKNQMIKITEIFPNPEGADGNNEWIELTNVAPNTPSDNHQPTTITDWTLDDSEGGSKPFTIPPLTLQPNQSTLLQKTETKLNLNNTSDEVRLLDEKQNPINSISYEKTIQGKSYALLTIKSATKTSQTWQWTEPTPNQPNQTLYHLTGHIDTPPEILDEFQFTFQPIQSEKPLTIIFEEDILDYQTAALALTPKTPIKLLTKKLTNSKFHLIDYHLETTTASPSQTQNPQASPTPQQQNLLPITILSLLIIVTAIATKLFKQKTN